MPTAAPPPQLVLDLRPPDPSHGKRWNARRPRWVCRSELFDPRGFAVDILDYTPAKRFVCATHYSASMVAAFTSVGLWRSTGGRGAELVGVAVFSNPAGGTASVRKYLGVSGEHGCDLGRFVLTDDVRFNGESWFLTRALRCLRQARPTMRGVVSYADPHTWYNAAGEIIKSAHYGGVYASLGSGVYAGRATARTLVLGPDGRPISGVGLTKVRRQKKGHAYVTAQLLALGAPPRRHGEAPEAWVDRVLASTSPNFSRRVRHPGNHTYLFALDDMQRRALRARHAGAPAVPKKPVAAGIADVATRECPTSPVARVHE